jgi:hypothetical protein
MTSKTEQVLNTLHAALSALAHCERNIGLPQKVPAGGLLVLRDGDPGEPERVLGGFGGVYYSHEVEIEVYVAEGDDAARDAAFDTLITGVGAALDADPTLGGLADGMTYARPSVDVESIEGAATIKSGVILLIVEYESPTSLG